MGYRSSLQKIFGFTQNEIRALLFLSSTFLAGLGLRWFQAQNLSQEPPRFDYARQDSIFAERSARQITDPPVKRQNQSGKPKGRPGKHSIDINTASKEDLMLLPGIGESYAERILIDRQDHGPFRSVDDLTRVKGIGKKTLARIREYLRPIDSPIRVKGEKDPGHP